MVDKKASEDKKASGQHRDFILQSLRSPYVLLQFVFKVKFTTKNRKTRRKFDFEDDSEENIRRSKLYAIGKSPCIYIRRLNLLQTKNPSVVHYPFCPHYPFCQPRARTVGSCSVAAASDTQGATHTFDWQPLSVCLSVDQTTWR